MNLRSPERIVVLGFLSHFPVAGVAWQTIHYLLGFQRLGYEVYYVEAHGCTPSKLMRSADDDGPSRAAEYVEGIMRRFDLGDRWAYHARYPEPRYFGMSAARLSELYQSAAWLINLHGSHLPTQELTAANRLVYVGTDPVDVEIDLHLGRPETLDYLAPHCAFFTFGGNLGRPDCRVPEPRRFKFRATFQPVILDLWGDDGPDEAATFTTIGNWRQPWRALKFDGQVYSWSKHLEFEKFLDLPRRARQSFELALSSYELEDQRRLEAFGWRVRPALELSRDLDAYRSYVTASRGEFTVAKDQNVRLRSGWFSDRAVTYLAAGRPVITQATGFSNLLPTGEGLFGFSTMEEILEAIEAINGDYRRHRRAARALASQYFSHEVVLRRMLEELGCSSQRGRPSDNQAAALPADLVLTPMSRWPTRLPESTVLRARELPVPRASGSRRRAGPRASIIIPTHNGLCYTRMCLASLLGQDWSAGDELIVVDNGSVDGTLEYLEEVRSRNSCVQVISAGRNLGFAAANNEGLRRATGEVCVLLNNDTLVSRGWLEGLVRWLGDPNIGLVGPVTNRTCNQAQIDAPYRTLGEMEDFARRRAESCRGQGEDIAMLAMFCVAMRREVLDRIGPLDERFEIGMFEDDDYARRAQAAGYRIVCAEDVFVHHFGQGTIGERCVEGEYDGILEANRRRFEAKWGVSWQPHARRLTPEYQGLRLRVRAAAAAQVPSGAPVLVISKGDEELVKLEGQPGWHFPQAEDGGYAHHYPAQCRDAIAQLEALRAKGARYLLIPKPGFWWLDYYREFGAYLESHYRLALRDEETCMLFDLGESHA